MTRRTSLVAIALATVLLAACSTSSSTTTAAATSTPVARSAPRSRADTAAYADGLCTSIDQWQQSLTDGSQSLQDTITAGNPTPQDVKDALEAYMTSAIEDTQTMLDDVHALGTPPGVEDATAAIETALTNVKTLFETVRSKRAVARHEQPREHGRGAHGSGAATPTGRPGDLGRDRLDPEPGSRVGDRQRTGL